MDGQQTEATTCPVHADDLKRFYAHLFPFKPMYQWLSYSSAPDENAGEFPTREFSFTLVTPSGEEIYVRNQSYTSCQQFQTELTKAAPHKIDIGGIYNLPPKQHSSHAADAMRVKEREFVFDIDMDDYSDVRRCCDSGKAKRLCARCWPFLHVAIQVIRRALKELFGFEHCLFVFSGRRGIHCWVADRRARNLTKKARQAILDFMIIPVVVSKEKLSTQPFYHDLHPFFRQIYTSILEPTFEESILIQQQLLDDQEGQEMLLRFVPHSETQEMLRTTWQDDGDSTSSAEKWTQFKEIVRGQMKKENEKGQKTRSYKRTFPSDPVVDVVFAYTYPRFDKHVSIGLNHLLKSPFCVHPGTGKLCVPIDPQKSEEFSPDQVPTLLAMMEEVATGKPRSMDAYVKYFEKKFLEPLTREGQPPADPMDF